MFVVIHFLDSMWSFCVEVNLHRFFLSFVYICTAIEDPFIKRGRIVTPLTGVTQPHVCPCPNPEHTFPTSYMS